MKNNKALGQHWLKNRFILDEIAGLAAFGAPPETVCLEIGPGLGTLTSSLLRRFSRVIAIEYDQKLAQNLPKSFPGKDLTVIHADVLSLNIGEIGGYAELNSEVVKSGGEEYREKNLKHKTNDQTHDQSLVNAQTANSQTFGGQFGGIAAEHNGSRNDHYATLDERATKEQLLQGNHSVVGRVNTLSGQAAKNEASPESSGHSGSSSLLDLPLELSLPESLSSASKHKGKNVAVRPYVVAGNIPYYITSPILRLALNADPQPTRIVLLVQKEVAERVGAGAGRNSLLSLFVQNLAQVELGPVVPAVEFVPPPKVDSQIIILTPRPRPIVSEQIMALAKTGFSNPRKKLASNLASTGRSKEEWRLKLNKLNLNPDARAQDLSLEDWRNLAI